MDIPNHTVLYKFVAERASHQFLHARITQTATLVRHLETDLYFQRIQLEFVLCPEHNTALNQLR